MNKFSLKNKNIIITGGAGLLGEQHVLAIVEKGGTPIIFDNNNLNILKLKKNFLITKLKVIFLKEVWPQKKICYALKTS